MEGELKSAEARVELTRKKWERADELQKKNFVSANARDESEAEYRLATEQLRAARENRRWRSSTSIAPGKCSRSARQEPGERVVVRSCSAGRG